MVEMKFVLLSMFLLFFPFGIKANDKDDSKSFLDKHIDFYITKYDFSRPVKNQKYKKISKFLKNENPNKENLRDVFIFSEQMIQEEENKVQKEILNSLIKKEVSTEDFKLNDQYEIFGYPDMKFYETYPTPLLKKENLKLKNFSDFPIKFAFEPKSIEIIDKPICIPTMTHLNIKNFKNDNLILKSIRSDLYQVTIFFLKGRDSSSNLKNLYPKTFAPNETLDLQIIFLPDTLGEVQGNLYFEFSDNKIILFPIKIKGIENIYKVEPIYISNWQSSKIFTQSLTIFNPQNKKLIIKEVINSFSSINLNWPNGVPVSSNSTSIDISMLEIPPKSTHVLLNVNFYKEVPGIEYGLLHIKTDRDTLIVPVLIRVEVQGLKIFPTIFNFGVIDLNQKIKRMIPISISNVFKKPLQIKRIYSFFEENMIDFIPTFHIKKSSEIKNKNMTPFKKKNINFVIQPGELIEMFGYLIFDPSNFIPDSDQQLYKKIKGNIIIHSNFTDSPFIYLNYEYYLDKYTFTFPEKSFEYYLPKSDFQAKFESGIKITSSLNIIVNDIISDLPILKVDFDKKNNYEKNLKIELKGDFTESFQNKKFYFLRLKFLNYFSIIPLKFFDRSLNFQYSNELGEEVLVKGINLENKQEKLDMGSISISEISKKVYNITNENPDDIILVDMELNNLLVNLESYVYYKNGNEDYTTKIHRSNIKKMSEKKELNLIIPANSVVSFTFTINSQNEDEIKSSINFIFEKKITFSFQIISKILKGNLNITPSVLRFEPAFPGMFQQKLISSKSSYNINANIHSFTSKDERIQPILLTDVIVSNNRTEILKITFDPSKVAKEDNYMKGEFNLDSQSKYVNFKELYLWKEKQKLWESLGSQGKTEINTYVTFQTNIQSEKVNVRAFLTKPSLVKNDEIDFGLVQIGETVSRDIEIYNPSDEIINVQFVLAPEEFSDIHNNSMFHKNRKFRFTPSKEIILMECCFYNSTNENYQQPKNKTKNRRKYDYLGEPIDQNSLIFSPIIIEDDINSNSMKTYSKYEILKKLFIFASNKAKYSMTNTDKYICHPSFIKKNDIITSNYNDLMEKIFSKEFNKDISIIKKMTDANPPSKKKKSEINYMSLVEKIGYYLKLFFKIDGNPENIKKKSKTSNQEIFLPKSLTNMVYTIKPRQKISIGPIVYNPRNFSNYSATLFVKNNLTILYPIKLRGMGGSGLFEYYLIEGIHGSIEKKIEKLVINLDTLTYNEGVSLNKGKIKKIIKVRNSGNLQMKIMNVSIENSGCENFGIKLSRCSKFTLDPEESITFTISVKPNFNYYFVQKNIIFQTDHHKIILQLNINIADDLLMNKNQLLNTKNMSFLHMAFVFCIITLIFYILTKESDELNSENPSKKSILFLSPKELIEKSPSLKIENLLLKTYRKATKQNYEEFYVIQGNSFDSIEKDKKKSLNSLSKKSDRKVSEESAKEKKIENIKAEVKPNITSNLKQEEVKQETEITNTEKQKEQKSVENTQNATFVPAKKKTNNKPKKQADRNTNRIVGLGNFNNNPTTNPTIPQPKTSLPKANEQKSSFNSSKVETKTKIEIPRPNHGFNPLKNNSFNQNPLTKEEYSGLYPNNVNYYAASSYSYPEGTYNKNKQFNKFSTGNEKNIFNNQINKDLKTEINFKRSEIKDINIQSKNELKEKLKIPVNEVQDDNYFSAQIEENNKKNIESDQNILKNQNEEEKQNNEDRHSSHSEIEDIYKGNFFNRDEESSNHDLSEKEKQFKESGTEDNTKREDIKLNFNSIFGYHSSLNIISNNENDKDQNDKEEKEVESNMGGGLYFNEKIFTNFDEVFKKPDSFWPNLNQTNNNPFVAENYNASALNELRDDDDEIENNENNENLQSKFEAVEERNDEIENDDEDDEKDPEWDDDTLDLKKEGYFDDTGVYKLKQIDFKFDLDINRNKK